MEDGQTAASDAANTCISASPVDGKFSAAPITTITTITTTTTTSTELDTIELMIESLLT